MVVKLTQPLPAHQVLQKVDRHLFVGREVDADVHGQKVEHLALRPELGREGLRRDLLLGWAVHDLVVLVLVFND